MFKINIKELYKSCVKDNKVKDSIYKNKNCLTCFIYISTTALKLKFNNNKFYYALPKSCYNA